MSRNALLLVMLALAGCDWFDDPTPRQIGLTLDGEAGGMVELVMSTQFVAGVTEAGVTQVQLFVADTLIRALPVDTVVSIAVDRRFFAQFIPLEADSAQVHVRVEVDARELFDDERFVRAEIPFRYVYLFNSRVTNTIEVF
jgi:hypothetical protein